MHPSSTLDSHLSLQADFGEVYFHARHHFEQLQHFLDSSYVLNYFHSLSLYHLHTANEKFDFDSLQI